MGLSRSKDGTLIKISGKHFGFYSFDELLDVITADEVMEYYKDKQYMLLDRIGKEKVKEYFNLKDNNE